TINSICSDLTSSNELNFNYFRFDIGGGDAPAHNHFRSDGGAMPGYKSTRTSSYNWLADSNQIKVLKKLYALKSSAIYEMAGYSPPYWMTKSGCAAGNTDGSDNLLDADYGTYANYLTDIVKHFKDVEGVNITKLEPFNEPFSTWWKAYGQQEGCKFSQANQNKLIDSVYQRLSAKNMLSYCNIAAMDGNTVDETLSGLNGYVSAGRINKVGDIATHTYSGTQHAQLYQAAYAQGKEIWQTESGPLEIYATGMDNYLIMASRIITDLKELKAVAWADWQAVSTDDRWGLWTYDITAKTYQKVKPYYIRKQFSKYIKPGYSIVYSNENTVAALSPSNNELVVVLVNTSASSVSYKLDMNLFGTVNAASVYRTTNTQNCVQLSNISATNNIYSYSAPAKSVTTFVIPVTIALNPISNGTYRITAKHSNKVMSVAGYSSTNGAIVEQWDWVNQSNEKFIITLTSNGYKIVPSYATSKVVQVDGAALTNSASVSIWDDIGTSNERFSIINVGLGYYKIVARHSAKCLAVNNNGIANGDDIVQYEWLNYDNFKWTFTAEASPLIAYKNKNVIEQNIVYPNAVVYPNPSKDRITINLKNLKEARVQISDVGGRIIYENKPVGDLLNVNLGKFGKGIYNVRITSINHSVTTPVVIK
ncbi:MAG: RICIN domain-containing protein, partial [Segetibacter sp.]